MYCFSMKSHHNFTYKNGPNISFIPPRCVFFVENGIKAEEVVH